MTKERHTWSGQLKQKEPSTNIQELTPKKYSEERRDNIRIKL